MKNIWFLSIFFVSLYSCDVYNYSNDNRVESILAVTEAGDTIAVPYRKFLDNRYDSYTRFYWNNNWYWNNWRYDYNWRWNYWYNNSPYFYNGGYYNFNNNSEPNITSIPKNNGRRGEKVTDIPTENDGIYVPPKPPRLKNDVKIIRNNTRSQWSPQSRNNGWISRSRQVVPSQPTQPRQSRAVQPGQVRRGSGSPVLQQPRSSQQSGKQGRIDSGRRQN